MPQPSGYANIIPCLPSIRVGHQLEIDALVREEVCLDPIGEEMVSLKPVLTDPVFI